MFSPPTDSPPFERQKSQGGVEKQQPTACADADLPPRFKQVRRDSFDDHHRRSALIELLDGIGIITLLAGTLLPALSRIKQRAPFIKEIMTASQLMVTNRLYTDARHNNVLVRYGFDLPTNDWIGYRLNRPLNIRHP